MAFADDFDWQRALIPRIKQILANYLICEAPFEEDARRNTDLIVLKLDTVRVACRLRRYSHLAAYGDQFTLRASRPSGVETELQKVLRGWGDYIFYGFVNEDGSDLAAWLLGDLDEFRLWHHRTLSMLPPGKQPGDVQRNRDGSSSFCAFRIDKMPPEFIKARKAYRPVAGAA